VTGITHADMCRHEQGHVHTSEQKVLNGFATVILITADFQVQIHRCTPMQEATAHMNAREPLIWAGNSCCSSAIADSQMHVNARGDCSHECQGDPDLGR